MADAALPEAAVIASDERVMMELMRLAREDPGRELYQFRSLASAHQYARLYRLMRRYVPPGARVLDWGAGNGHFSYFLLNAGYAATGYALGSAGAFRAWLPPGDYEFVCGSPDEPRRLPFPDACFDAVASVGVLEHVRETGGDELSSLRDLARVLRPGGVVLCYHLPNRWSPIEAVARRIPGKHHHRWRYSPGEVRALVGEAGLELLELRRYAFLPRNTLGWLPGVLARSAGLARLWDGCDLILGRAAPVLCQNHLFVARKTVPQG